MVWRPEYLVIGFALGLIGFSLYRALHAFRRMRALADTPIAKIRSAPQGYVELRGRTQLMKGDAIYAPLSGLPCVWYRYQIQRLGRGTALLGVTDRGISDALFLLEDETGSCVLDPDGAEFIKATRDVWYSDEYGHRVFSLWGIGADFRHIEQRILIGDEVHAIGLFKTTGGYREPPDTRREVARLLESWKKDPRRIALFDRRKNGRIDPDEWEAVRRAAHRQVQRQQLACFLEPEVHLLSNPGNPGQPYLIAAVSEHRLIRHYQWQALLYLMIALATGVWLIWL